MLSSLVPNFKGKGDTLNRNSYRGIKLLEHAFKLYEILEGRLCEVVDIDKMQYWFMPGKQTVDAVFFYLEKAFDWVPKEVICNALR